MIVDALIWVGAILIGVGILGILVRVLRPRARRDGSHASGE
ncbi:MAG: hypothetical protein PVJ27_03690 [Candidatus Brocadiaceae bacterium]|jgi:hypothetical protein